MNKTHFMRLLLATLLLGAQPLLAQTCSNSVTATAPDSRYTDNLDGTVTDNQTGLMWRQCSEGLSTTDTACDTGSAVPYTWQVALQQVQTINVTGFAGYTDWRLPNHNELTSLLENSCFSPAINTTAFPVTPAFNYWSASPHANLPGSAWYVSFNHGFVDSSNKTLAYRVRLVRGGQ
ncbi:MAG: DUF1566 domain-containing protein [Gammaproteobacteria bacterium]|nr:DUF1566 domain-containing protein [Gammaproteobacteria bacterium]